MQARNAGPGGAGGSGAPHWRRRATAAATDHLALKGTAVLLSIILWFIVTAKEPTEELVPVTFAPALDSTLVLRDPPPPIRALVIGTGQELLKLYRSPLVIRRPIAADAPDTLVLDLQPGDVALPPGVDAIVRDVQPRSVTLRFEPTITRVVPVRSNLQILAEPWPGPVATWFEPDRVEISGPRRAVFRIASVPTARVPVPVNDSLPHLVDIDTSRLGVKVRPTQIKVRVTALGGVQGPAGPLPMRRGDPRADSARAESGRGQTARPGAAVPR